MQPNPHEQVYAADLAERWEVAPDGSSITFYLRENACFHDGEPVTADDVAFSFTAYMAPRTGSRAVQSLSMVRGADAFADGTADSVEGITVVDHYTVRFDMAFPTGQFLAQVADVYILPEHILGSMAPEEIDDSDFFTGLGAQRPIGSGPWLFVIHQPDQFHELEAHEDYHFGMPKIERVFIHLINSSDAAVVAMQRGEIHGIRSGYLSPYDFGYYHALLHDPRFLVNATTQPVNGGGYSFNIRTDWIRDSRIRQAFMWALGRRQLIDTFEDGQGYIHNTNLFVPTGVETPEMKARYTPYGNAATARQLLEDAGWDFEREITAKTPWYSGNVLDQLAAEQQMLADAGLKVKYETMETPAWAAVYFGSHDYDLVRADGWAGALDAIDYYLHSATGGPRRLQPDHGAVRATDYYLNNTNTDPMGYASPELDALLDAVPRCLTNEELVDIGIGINEMLLEDLPIVVISSPARLHTYRANVWVPGFGRRPQPNRLEEILFTPEFHGPEDSWGYMVHQTDVTYSGHIHPLNETGPISKQIAIQLSQ